LPTSVGRSLQHWRSAGRERLGGRRLSRAEYGQYEHRRRGAPTTYRQFSANEQCYGCHGDNLPLWVPETAPPVPKITDITPKVGTWDYSITLTGEQFGSALTPERSIRIKSTSAGDWSQVPIWFWTDTEIQFTIPSGTLEIGNFMYW